jgi:hypothetical protein
MNFHAFMLDEFRLYRAAAVVGIWWVLEKI